MLLETQQVAFPRAKNVDLCVLSGSLLRRAPGMFDRRRRRAFCEFPSREYLSRRRARHLDRQRKGRNTPFKGEEEKESAWLRWLMKLTSGEFSRAQTCCSSEHANSARTDPLPGQFPAESVSQPASQLARLMTAPARDDDNGCRRTSYFSAAGGDKLMLLVCVGSGVVIVMLPFEEARANQTNSSTQLGRAKQ